jgi:2-oxoisovalerate dehydrogenase E1 component
MDTLHETPSNVKTTLQPAEIDWLKVTKLMLTSRALDRLEVEELAPAGKVKYQFSAGGHELIQVLLAHALDHPHDAATVYYRSRPFLLACGLDLVEALAAGMARAGSPTQGRDVGVMFNMPHQGGPMVLPASGDVGAQYTPAAGWAQAIRYREEILQEPAWSGAIAVAMGGEGSIAANGFWAALNMVTTLQLPYLFFIENNHYGLSVPADLQTPNGNIAANLSSFGNLTIFDGDGTQPLQAWELISAAVRHVRSGAGAGLLHLRIPRLAGHTLIDDQAYKTPEQRAAESARDPLRHMREFMLTRGLSAGEWDELFRQADQEVREATALAERLANPAPNEVRRYIFFEGSTPMQGGLRPEGAHIPPGDPQPQPSGPRLNLVDAVRRTLETELAINPRLLVFGEDVGVKGGVHGATRGLQSHFGRPRVFDTSLSEDAIIGRSTGLALAGLLPVPEIQFRKYADPAHEQLDDLGTLRWRTANRFAAPVVVRIAVGFGKSVGDPWHSVTGEAVYAHMLGWRIAFPSNAEDAVGLLRSALRGDDPTFFFEHRALLDTPEARRPYPGDAYCLPFGRAIERTHGDQLTIVSWGAMLHRCLEAAREYTDRITVLDLRTLIPWDKELVLASVRDTGKVLVVHEDTLTAGFAAEIIAVINEQAFEFLDAPVARLATPDIPVPYNAGLMELTVPNVARIRAKIQELLSY